MSRKTGNSDKTVKINSKSSVSNDNVNSIDNIVIGYNYDPVDVKRARKKLLVRRLRSIIINTGKRSDGRGVEEVRPISIGRYMILHVYVCMYMYVWIYGYI